MDMSAFSDENFNARDWINTTFRSPEVQENRDAFVSSLVMKLQLYVQQVNSALEETSQQVLQSLPRVMRDTDVLQQEALMLKEKMKTVREEMSKVQSDTGESLATLEHIDTLKTRLQKAKQALHEADNWSLLAADLEEVFESGDIESMSSRLTKMQQSLGALTSVPDYEERRLQLEGLKNRLEAIASPRLVQAFTSGSIEQSRVYVRIFVNMDRLSQLLKYYHKCQKGILLQQWRGIVDVEQDEVIRLLKSCYEMVLAAWSDQVKWCSQVFTSIPPPSILVDLFADTLASLEPSLNSCFDGPLKEETDPLSLLLELSQCTQHFVTNLQAAIDSSCQGKYSVPDEKLLALARSVYHSWIPYVKQYSKLESENLKKKMTANIVSQEDLAETVQSLGLSVTSAVGTLTDAQKRCMQFSHGCAYIGLLKAIKSYFSSYLEQFQTALKRLDKQKGNGEDWNMFQMCLSLLQGVGQLLSEVRHLDKELLQSLLNSTKTSPDDKSSPFTNYRLLLLDETGRREFDLLLKSFQDGGEEYVLKSVLGAIEKLCGDVHRTTFAVILAPITVQLNLVQSAPAWCATVAKSPVTLTLDLPDYSFAPQEYITQIGQYLMTLPQHLEPFLLRDNPALTLALSVAVSDGVGGSADLLLAGVARTTCLTYCDRILGIAQLSSSACKQLATDIDYLGNVLEDLGLSLSDQLSQLSTLLRIPADEYQSQSSGCQPKLVAAVRQMREITTS